MKKIKKEKKPFFSKFLEAQKVDQTETFKGGVWPPYDQTMKYPSDGDEGGPTS